MLQVILDSSLDILLLIKICIRTEIPVSNIYITNSKS
jgi:hypothetical protein